MKEFEESIANIKKHINYIESVIFILKNEVFDLEELFQNLVEKTGEDTDKVSSQIIDDICKMMRKLQ